MSDNEVSLVSKNSDDNNLDVESYHSNIKKINNSLALGIVLIQVTKKELQKVLEFIKLNTFLEKFIKIILSNIKEIF